MNTWQPIKTAPLEMNTSVLLRGYHVGGCDLAVGHFDGGYWVSDETFERISWDPTEWGIVPAAPEFQNDVKIDAGATGYSLLIAREALQGLEMGVADYKTLTLRRERIASLEYHLLIAKGNM